jgi:hypothetical protein
VKLGYNPGMTKLVALGALLLAACGDDGGATADAPPSAPPMITITGTAIARSTSSMPLEGVTIAAYRSGDDSTVVAMTTTAANGSYTLVVPTGGVALDGYLKGTISGYLDSYLYAPSVIVADMDSASMNMITSGTRDLLANTICAANQLPTNGMIAAITIDAAENPVAGAMVTSSPAASKTCYNMGGFPNKNATATDTDGTVYLFNVTGQASLSATATGTTFSSHSVNARAGAFTTTLLAP